MPRALRLQDAGYVHHVVSRGNDKMVLFKSEEDFSYYIDLLEHARKHYPLKIYNYVLMDNHIHLLVEPEEDGSLSKVMEYVTKGYAKYFNKKYDHTGHVFSGRFKSFLIQEERYFISCSRYIDLNPVKANIVNDPQDYAWSGYREIAFGQKSALRLDYHDLYQSLGNNQNEQQLVYKAMIVNYQGEELDLLNKRASVLGDKTFKEQFKNR